MNQRKFGTQWIGIMHPFLHEIFVTELSSFHYEMFVE